MYNQAMLPTNRETAFPQFTACCGLRPNVPALHVRLEASTASRGIWRGLYYHCYQNILFHGLTEYRRSVVGGPPA